MSAILLAERGHSLATSRVLPSLQLWHATREPRPWGRPAHQDVIRKPASAPTQEKFSGLRVCSVSYEPANLQPPARASIGLEPHVLKAVIYGCSRDDRVSAPAYGLVAA